MTASVLRDEALRQEFSRVKRLWAWLLGLQVFLLAVPAIVLLLRCALLSYVGLLATLIGTAAVFVVRGEADSVYERAEALRRAKLLADGLGHQNDVGDAMSAFVELTDEPSPDPLPVGGYYNSALAEGPRRLAHVLWESAHCTAHLAKVASNYAAAAAAAGGLGIGALYSTVLCCGITAEVGERLATAGTALLSVFGFGIFADLQRTFSGLASAAKDTCSRCQRLLEASCLGLCDVLPVLEQYNVALGRAAPLPSYIWTRNQDRLARSWKMAEGRYVEALSAGSRRLGPVDR